MLRITAHRGTLIPGDFSSRTGNGGGYRILTANGTVYNYGNAGYYGDAAAVDERRLPGQRTVYLVEVAGVQPTSAQVRMSTSGPFPGF